MVSQAPLLAADYPAVTARAEAWPGNLLPYCVLPRSAAGQRAERDDQVAVVRGGLPTHLPCPLHARAAGDQGRLRRAGELQADASLARRRGRVLLGLARAVGLRPSRASRAPRGARGAGRRP